MVLKQIFFIYQNDNYSSDTLKVGNGSGINYEGINYVKKPFFELYTI